MGNWRGIVSAISILCSKFFCRISVEDQTKGESPITCPQFPPPAPRELLSRPDHNLAADGCQPLPFSEISDTPLFALYRIYEHLILNRTVSMRNELEYFWFQPWPVALIPDPKDSDPERYAVLACIPALLISSFNARIALGIPRHASSLLTRQEIYAYRQQPKAFETVPEWTFHVEPLHQVLKIPHDGHETLQSFDDERASKELKAKNILCWQPHIHFI